VQSSSAKTAVGVDVANKTSESLKQIVDAVEKPFSSPISGKKMAQVFSAPFRFFMPLN